MAIVVNINSGEDFEPVSEGVHSVVLADIVDLGVVQTSFGPKEKVQFVYLSDEADENGRTKRVFERFTKSLHEKASLRKRVKQLRGGKDIEGSSFDVETLIGSQARVVIQHSENPSTGKIYANVQAVMKPEKKIAIPADFQRKKDSAPKATGLPVQSAPKSGGGTAAARAVLAPAGAFQATDDDLGF